MVGADTTLFKKPDFNHLLVKSGDRTLRIPREGTEHSLNRMESQSWETTLNDLHLLGSKDLIPLQAKVEEKHLESIYVTWKPPTSPRQITPRAYAT